MSQQKQVEMAQYNHKILIVENNRNSLLVLEQILRPENFQLIVITYAEVVWSLIQEEPPDLFLLDTVAPELKGLELCSKLKKNRILAHIPVVCITADSADDILEKVFAAGAVDYISKPYNRLKILARVRTQLQTYKVTAELANKNQRLRELAENTSDRTKSVLRNSEIKWNSLVNTQVDIVLMIDQEARIVFINRGFEDHREMVIPGELIYDVLPEEFHSLIKYSIENVLNEKNNVQYEVSVRINNSCVWFSITVLSRQQNSKLAGFIVILKNITVNKTNERKLLSKTLQLDERIKELNCLFNISNLFVKNELSLEEIIRDTLKYVVEAMQVPENAVARVVLDDNVYETAGFRLTQWVYKKDLKINGETCGAFYVCYLSQIFASGVVFLIEERNLIETIFTNLCGIIERVKAERELRRERDYSTRLIKETPAVIWGIDKLGITTFVNPACEKLTGYRSEELVGRNWWNTLCPTGEYHRLKQVFTEPGSGDGSGQEMSLVRKDGTRRTVFWNSINRYDAQGQLSELIGFANDITNRQKTQEALIRSQNNLADAQRVARMGSAEWNLRTGEIKWSDELYRIYNIPKETTDLRRAVEEKIHQDDLKLYKEAINQGLEQQKSYDIEYRIVQGASTRVLHGEGKAISSRDTRLRFIETVQDITEYRTMENQIAQTRKLESIGQLSAGIAHEINTPMQYVNNNITFLIQAFKVLEDVIQGYSDFLNNMVKIGVADELIKGLEGRVSNRKVDYIKSQISPALEQSMDGVRRVNKIVYSMKEFSHPNSRKKTLADLHRAIDNTLTISKNEWKYVADVITDFDPTLGQIPCFKDDMNQVFLNLVVNAAHSIGEKVSESEERGTITIKTRRQDEWAELLFSDTGCGIQESVMSRIFEPFFTTKDIGKGTGQGLSITYSIIQKHGGAIEAQSEVGKGTTFTIRLPLLFESGN